MHLDINIQIEIECNIDIDIDIDSFSFTKREKYNNLIVSCEFWYLHFRTLIIYIQ